MYMILSPITPASINMSGYQILSPYFYNITPVFENNSETKDKFKNLFNPEIKQDWR